MNFCNLVIIWILDSLVIKNTGMEKKEIKRNQPVDGETESEGQRRRGRGENPFHRSNHDHSTGCTLISQLTLMRPLMLMSEDTVYVTAFFSSICRTDPEKSKNTRDLENKPNEMLYQLFFSFLSLFFLSLSHSLGSVLWSVALRIEQSIRYCCVRRVITCLHWEEFLLVLSPVQVVFHK